MNQWTALYAPLLGRILLGGFFLWSGIQKALTFPTFVDFFSLGTPYAIPVTMTIVVVEVLLGIALVIDLKVTIAALVLAIYMTVTSLFFVNIETSSQVHSFLQNMAIIGGLLALVGSGTNRWTPAWRR